MLDSLVASPGEAAELRNHNGQDVAFAPIIPPIQDKIGSAQPVGSLTAHQMGWLLELRIFSFRQFCA